MDITSLLAATTFLALVGAAGVLAVRRLRRRDRVQTSR